MLEKFREMVPSVTCLGFLNQRKKYINTTKKPKLEISCDIVYVSV